MRSCYRITLLAIFLFYTAGTLAASEQEDRLRASRDVLQEILDMSDNGIPTELLAKASLHRHHSQRQEIRIRLRRPLRRRLRVAGSELDRNTMQWNQISIPVGIIRG